MSAAQGLGYCDDRYFAIGSILKYPDKFNDLNSFGAKDLAKDFLDWKWNQSTVGEKQLGLPTDIGPMVLYYRQDLFQQAGLPSEPNDVAAKIKTWDDFLAAGKTLKEKTGADILSNPNELFGAIRDQGDELYFDKDDQLIIEKNPQVKKALDYFKRPVIWGLQAATIKRTRFKSIQQL